MEELFHEAFVSLPRYILLNFFVVSPFVFIEWNISLLAEIGQTDYITSLHGHTVRILGHAEPFLSDVVMCALDCTKRLQEDV